MADAPLTFKMTNLLTFILIISLSANVLPFARSYTGYGLPTEEEKRRPLKVKRKGKVKGVVTKLSYADPTQRQMYHLADIVVEDGRHDEYLIKVTTDTSIKDLKLSQGYVRLLQEGTEIKCEYVITDDDKIFATSIIVQKEVEIPSPKKHKDPKSFRK